MHLSLTHRSLSATAFPVRDAPCALPAARVTNLQAGVLNNRKELHVGCWNVRTMLDVGCQAITMRSLFEYRVDVACLSEVRLPGHGIRQIKVPGIDSSYWLYHSGYDDALGQHGVAITLSSNAHKALMSWTPVSPRIALARLRGRPFNITIVSVYAPTLAADNSTKDDFYEQLQDAVNNVPRNDILVVAGDWNARTGPADNSTGHILGRFGLGERCDNGGRLVDFAAFNHLCVCNTKFQHARKHLVTWYSNDGRTANQIDYILVRSRWMSSVQDCRSYRGAEAGNAGGSDHTLVRAKFKLSLISRLKRTPRKRLNTLALDDAHQRSTLTAAIARGLAENDGDIEHQWSNLKVVTQAAALEHLGTSCHRRCDWISEHTVRLSAQAREARLNRSPDYRRLRRGATRSARRDRQRYWAEMACTMESASNASDFGRLFRLIRKASGRRGSNPSLRDASGHLIFDLENKVTRWVEHFSQLLNRTSNASLGMALMVEETAYPVNCDQPTESEIADMLWHMKNGKSPGEDGLPVEIYKSCASALLSPLHKLFCSIWEAETFPADWGTSILLPLPKNGDRSVCNNYRGISLIDAVAKLFGVILLNRFSIERHRRTRINQGGFRPGMGCVDQIFTLRRILEHRAQYQQPTIACFVDFRAAFDSVDRASLWNIMLQDGTPPKLVNLIRAYYASTKARVRVYGEESCDFDLHTGVRQGCPLSPVLFNYVVDWIMDKALEDYRGVQVSTDFWLADIDYADDVAVLGESPAHLQPFLDRISSFAAKVGLEINASKTKAFTVGLPLPVQCLSVDGSPVEFVPAFKYLGSSMLPNGQAKQEVKARVDRARVAFVQLKGTLWRRSEISLKTKVRVYQAAIRPILLYGCETWPLRSEDVRKLEAFDHWCLRLISGVRYTDRVTNLAVRARCNGTTLLSVHIQRRRLQWFGHVLRKGDTALTRLVIDPKPARDWRRRRGGQVKTWLSTVKADMEVLGMRTVYGCRRWDREWIAISSDLASDRRAWAGMIRDVNGAG